MTNQAAPTVGRTLVPERVPPAWVRDTLPGAWQRVADLWVGQVEWTPEACRRVLEERNRGNRRPIPSQVAMLAKAMGDGEFYLTGETIIFDVAGRLLNGQNRLMAGVKSEEEFTTLVVVGVEEKVFHVLDQGSRRSLAQVLAIKKEAHPETVSTLLYGIPRFYLTGELQTRSRTNPVVHTIESLLEGLDRYPRVRDSAAFAAKFRGGPGTGEPIKKLRGRGNLALLHWVLSMVDEPLAEDYLTRLCKGQAGDDPQWQIVATANNLLMQNCSTRPLGPQLTEIYPILAWNAVREKATVKHLRFAAGNQPYPRVSGWHYEGDRPVCPERDLEG